MNNSKSVYRIIDAFALFMLVVIISVNCFAEEDEGDLIQKQAEMIWKLQRDRGKDIQFLLDIIKDKSRIRNELRVLAVRALGDIRAEEAAPVLIENIDIIAPQVWKELLTEKGRYPCYGALVKIGKPGSKLALEELLKDMKKFRRSLLIKVILDVEGERTGEFLINQSITEAQDSKAKGNLRKALETLNSLKGK